MEITKEQLSQMYLGTELNCEEIGKLLNTSGSTIARRLRFYKILARKTHTDKAKEKMRNANLGKRYSIKTEFKKGHKWPKNIELQRGKNISKALKGRKGISPSEKTREKLSAAIRGAKSYLWKGGITPAVNKRIKDRFWRKISKRIRKRDNYTCQKCAGTGNVVHHITPYLETQDNRDSNLITLCYKCHAIAEHLLRKKGQNNGKN